MTRASVVGGGAWGTAIANLLATNGHPVAIWAREPDVVASISQQNENPRFLPGAALHPALEATNDLRTALEDRSIVVLAAPSEHLRTILRGSETHINGDSIVVVATKGIERGSHSLMTEVAEQELPGRRVVALSGPSFAAEVAAKQPTAVVAASVDTDAATGVQRLFSNSFFRVYTHADVTGVELGGSLKNVMAVATGIAEGAGLGHNSRAALITRGLAEMIRLGVARGARATTFAGLAGLGDLVLTCTGSLSRNRSLGVEIGRGATLEEAMAGKVTVAEGVGTAKSAADLAARSGVEMPIVELVNRILFEGLAAREAMPELMSRELRPEQDT